MLPPRRKYNCNNKRTWKANFDWDHTHETRFSEQISQECCLGPVLLHPTDELNRMDQFLYVCVTLSLSEHDVTRFLHKMKRELPNSYHCTITKNENESRYADQLTANKIVTWRSINEAVPSQNTPYLHEIDKKNDTFFRLAVLDEILFN